MLTKLSSNIRRMHTLLAFGCSTCGRRLMKRGRVLPGTVVEEVRGKAVAKCRRCADVGRN